MSISALLMEGAYLLHDKKSVHVSGGRLTSGPDWATFRSTSKIVQFGEKSMSTIPFKNPQCPRCFNKDAYVTLMVPTAFNESTDEYFCDCGKCGLRFHAILERRAWLAVETPPPESSYQGVNSLG